jgi:hypothetical protein
VKIQGKVALAGLDVLTEAGGRATALVKEFKGVGVNGDLVVEFIPKTAKTAILCGVEIELE